MREVLKISAGDSVAVALVALNAGAELDVEGQKVVLATDVPAGHNYALKDIAQSEAVIKYGYPIGQAKCDIAVGSHVHVHNLKTLLSSELTYEHHPDVQELEAREPVTFMGYPRKDGRVGVRNELWILPTVGCVNDVARALERKAQKLVAAALKTCTPSRIPTAVPR